MEKILPRVNPEYAATLATELTAKYFRALGDPTRLKILELLIEGEMTVTDLVETLQLSQSRVSNHLACLRWCNLVTSTAEGRWISYSVTDPNLKKIIALGRGLVAKSAEHVAACTRIDS
jgi:DNA-binding transcriptional ArsR family regulator